MGRHRKKRAVVPVRTGLLGASAAMAVGAVAVASGMLPGGDTYKVGGGPSGGQIRTGAPELQTQGEASATPTGRASVSPSRSAERTQAPAKKPSPTPTRPSSSAPPKRTGAPEPSKAPAAPKTKSPKTKSPKTTSPKTNSPKTESAPARSATPSRTASATPERTVEQPNTDRLASKERAAEAAVLTLVNAERAKVGCSPVRPDADLASLAGAFSADMAARGFFSHTDPDGDSPWNRAAQAGVTGLAAENIARGQSDAEAVMESWMNSDGHRANILNCDYKTLGVGVQFGEGGPWWTQDFGF
ncbi:CAP domain-containing protein [Streptomyces sp. NPDC006368]|uniref:CAP domain-containing protein n=1 Tax=Streptomyces sp. NPDC006368 TaxID=3156760 RepID=UPI0033AD64EF